MIIRQNIALGDIVGISKIENYAIERYNARRHALPD